MNKTDSVVYCYNEGYTAFNNGLDYTENPYPYGSDAWNSWDDGWERAEEDEAGIEIGDEEEEY